MNTFLEAFSKLKQNQKLAVETIDGPVLVLAGPGTGKTEVLALRIANILQKTDASPENILCLTFTESGVQAMKQRLFKFIGKDSYYLNIFTFHGFCNSVIQAFPNKFGFKKDLQQIKSIQSIKILRKVLDELSSTSPEHSEDKDEQKWLLIPLFDSYKNQKAILDAIQVLKREGVSSETLAQIARENLEVLKQNPKLNRKGNPSPDWISDVNAQKKNLELSEIFKRYSDELTANGFYDFDDMLLFVLKAFNEDDELLAYFQEKYLYILVDEYQDTNGAQNKILSSLGSFDSSPNIFVVGDDDQAIYRFQGANVENLLEFKQVFENVKITTLNDNFRSSQIILDASDSLIKNNNQRLTTIIKDLNKTLISHTSFKNLPIEVYEHKDGDSELRFIAEKIEELYIKGKKYSDIAVFYRRNENSNDLVDYLIKKNIPINLKAGNNAVTDIYVNQFINLLKTAFYEQKNRDETLFEVLNYKFLGFDTLSLFKLVRLYNDINNRRIKFADEAIQLKYFAKSHTLMDVIEDDFLIDLISLSDKSKIKTFSENLAKWNSDFKNFSLIDAISHIAEESGFISYLFEDIKEIDSINAFNSFYSYVKELNRENRFMSLQNLLEDLNLMSQNKIIVPTKEFELKNDAVNLMTAHSAKGLQFKNVFIYKCFDAVWGKNRNTSVIKLPEEVFARTKEINPEITKILAEEKKVDVEDERRLFFVCLTRAQERIFISYAKKYIAGDQEKVQVPSRFIHEINSKFLQYSDTSKFEEVSVSEIKQVLSPITLRSSSKINEYLGSIVKDFKMSASALNLYLKCPLEFMYKKILQVPVASNKSLILGNSIHYALEQFFKAKINNENTDLDYLLYSFSIYLNKQLISQKELFDILKEGKNILSGYYNNYMSSFITPLAVEYGFYNSTVLLGENEEAVFLTGKIDKIEPVSSESSFETTPVRVVDYKTSSPVTENEIKGNTAKGTGDIFRQMVFYKLLSLCNNNFGPKNKTVKYDIVEVMVDFLKPEKGKYKQISLEITDNDVSALKALIFDIHNRIQNLEFFGSTEYQLCNNCEFCKLSNSHQKNGIYIPQQE